MKVLVTGSRDWTDRKAIRAALIDSCASIVIEGGQRGADTIAREEALALGLDVRTHWANWERHGKAAGPIRNQAMLHEHPDIKRVLAFRLQASVGTVDMVKRAKAAGIEVVEMGWKMADGTRDKSSSSNAIRGDARPRDAGWQPIESAPKDGTRVLLYWPYWSTQPILGYWHLGEWHSEQALEGHSEPPRIWHPLPPLPVDQVRSPKDTK